MAWEQANKVLKCFTHCITIKSAQQVCLSHAVLAMQEANKTLSLSQAARRFNVLKSTLSTRLHGIQD